MKALVLNLPHPQVVYRCYRCSINSPAFCLPPLELLYLAGVLREAGVDTRFIDAPAEHLNLKATIDLIRQYQPDLVVSIMGYEHFTDDVDSVNAIIEGAHVPHYAVMGYLPTHFWEETFQHLKADMILRFEAEGVLRDTIDAMKTGQSLENIPGLAWRNGKEIHVGPDRPRLNATQLESLPLPARDMLKVPLYREPFLSKPFTSFQAGRGCPFSCIYCTRTLGKHYTVRSPAHVVSEIEDSRRRFGIRHFRFTDDTFGINLNWTREFAERMEATGGRYQWVALTRVDLMDPERMQLLRRAGCRRLYVGIESGSQKILDYYHKGYKVEQVPTMVANARWEGLEIVGYFVVGSPIETEDDYRQTVALARGLQLDMASVYPMMPYPGTMSHKEAGAEVEFSLYPYRMVYRDPSLMDLARRRARKMMKSIYLSPRFITSKIKWSVEYPGYTLEAGLAFGQWLLQRPGKKRQSLL